MKLFGVHLWYDIDSAKFYYKDKNGVTQEFTTSGGGGLPTLYAADIVDFADAARDAVVLDTLDPLANFVLPEGLLGAGSQVKAPSVNVVNDALLGKSDVGHTHPTSQISNFDLAVQTQPKTIQLTCSVSANVGDLVYQDLVEDEKAIVATNNLTLEPVIGVIYSKPSSFIANVLLLGAMSGYAGLTKGGKVWLSSTGTITQTKPSFGYMQALGVALSSSKVLFIPSIHRTKLT